MYFLLKRTQQTNDKWQKFEFIYILTCILVHRLSRYSGLVFLVFHSATGILNKKIYIPVTCWGGEKKERFEFKLKEW